MIEIFGVRRFRKFVIAKDNSKDTHKKRKCSFEYLFHPIKNTGKIWEELIIA